MTTELRPKTGTFLLAAEYPGSAMRRILLSCALLGVLTLPAARSPVRLRPAKPGYLVVKKAAGDGGVNGRPVVTLVVRGLRARPRLAGSPGRRLLTCP